MTLNEGLFEAITGGISAPEYLAVNLGGGSQTLLTISCVINGQSGHFISQYSAQTSHLRGEGGWFSSVKMAISSVQCKQTA